MPKKKTPVARPPTVITITLCPMKATCPAPARSWCSAARWRSSASSPKQHERDQRRHPAGGGQPDSIGAEPAGRQACYGDNAIARAVIEYA